MLVERFVFTPVTPPPGLPPRKGPGRKSRLIYELKGEASLSGLIAGLISASSVAAPPGFEPVFRGGHVFADIRSFLAGRSVENRLGIEIRGTQGASMDSVQEQLERAVGDAFVTWYNKQHGTEFRFSARGAEPPDLVYRFGDDELAVEVSGA